MDWIDALQIVIARTGHTRYEQLCAEGYHDRLARDGYRALMVRMATGEPEPQATPEDLALRSHLARRPCCG